MRPSAATVVVCCLLGTTGARADWSGLLAPIYCSDRTSQQCRSSAALCISRACQGVSPDQKDKDRDCRAQCFPSLSRCLTSHGCN